MAKSDFNIDENEYYDENSNSNNMNNENINNYSNDFDSNDDSNDIYKMDYSSDSDFSNIGLNNNNNNNNYYENSDVLFDEVSDKTAKDRINYKVSTMNKNVILLFAIIFIIVVAIIITIVLVIADYKKSYTAEISLPDIIYMGETEAVLVKAKGKTDVSNTITSFYSSEPNIISFAQDEMTGSDVTNMMIPADEGSAEIQIKSVSGKRTLKKINKKVTVCPGFNASLIKNKSIAITVDQTKKLNIDFGVEECGKDVVYQSLNEKIYKITPEGEITAVSVGNAALKVSKGNKSFVVPVYVRDNEVIASNFSVDKDALQLVPNQTKRLYVSFYPNDTTWISFHIRSSDSEIVDLENENLVRAKKEGSATISVTSSNPSIKYDIPVVVSNVISKEGAIATDLKLGISKLDLNQGDSYVLNTIVVPGNTKDKKITYTSSNKDVADVNEYGVIYAKNGGQTEISARTSNGIRKSVNVSVKPIAIPTIKATDGVYSNLWHRKIYELKFTSPNSGIDFYYGVNSAKQTKHGDKAKITKEGTTNYYVKACRNNICSSPAVYVSKLDTKKPEVLKVIETSQGELKIPILDQISLVDSWCVNKNKSFYDCKWNKIPVNDNPIVSYNHSSNTTYYVFAKDLAGNISDGYKYKTK